jgi:hypothetical protein
MACGLQRALHTIQGAQADADTETMRRPSPSLIVSLIALVFSVSGTAYAVRVIDGKLLKNRSVPGSKLRPNALTGTQIRESRLGTVPRALRADSATTATSATSATSATRAATAGRADSAGQAGNAATVGGLGPAAFTQGGGRTVALTRLVTTSDGLVEIGTVTGFGRFRASCTPTDMHYDLLNDSTADVAYAWLADGASFGATATPGNQILALTTTGSDHIRLAQLTRADNGAAAVFTVAAVRVAGGCRYTLEGTLS